MIQESKVIAEILKGIGTDTDDTSGVGLVPLPVLFGVVVLGLI
jgi:hypothetical protein